MPTLTPAPLSLDCASPPHVPKALRAAAQQYRDSAAELQNAWQDKNAGHVWLELAAVLDHAAEKADRMVAHWHR